MELETVRVLCNVAPPETIKVSSIVVVPPEESILKLPVEVSILLSSAMPILMLSIVAPPLASRSPVNVEVPETIKISSIVVVPPEESILKLPVEVSILLSSAIPILILSIVAPPLTSRSPVNVVLPPTFRFFAIPTPPFIMTAPFVIAVDCSSSFTFKVKDDLEFAGFVNVT